jgi:hypothetical protein
VEIKRPGDPDELDAKLVDLFRSIERAEPSPDFVARTMNAIRVEPLPAGRRALRHPWSAPLLWTMLVGVAAVVVYGVFLDEAVAAKMLASVVALTLQVGAQLVRYLVAVFAMTELFATVGDAVSRAAATREGTTTLMWTAALAGSSLLALQRLLFSKGEEPQWQELS